MCTVLTLALVNGGFEILFSGYDRFGIPVTFKNIIFSQMEDLNFIFFSVVSLAGLVIYIVEKIIHFIYLPSFASQRRLTAGSVVSFTLVLSAVELLGTGEHTFLMSSRQASLAILLLMAILEIVYTGTWSGQTLSCVIAMQAIMLGLQHQAPLFLIQSVWLFGEPQGRENAILGAGLCAGAAIAHFAYREISRPRSSATSTAQTLLGIFASAALLFNAVDRMGNFESPSFSAAAQALGAALASALPLCAILAYFPLTFVRTLGAVLTLLMVGMATLILSSAWSEGIALSDQIETIGELFYANSQHISAVIIAIGTISVAYCVCAAMRAFGFAFSCAAVVSAALVLNAVHLLGPSPAEDFSVIGQAVNAVASTAIVLLAGLSWHPPWMLRSLGGVASLLMVCTGFCMLSPYCNSLRQPIAWSDINASLSWDANLESSELTVLPFVLIGLLGTVTALVLLSSAASYYFLFRVGSGAAVSAALVINAVQRLQPGGSRDLLALCGAVDVLAGAAIVIAAGASWHPPWMVRSLGGLASLLMVCAGFGMLSRAVAWSSFAASVSYMETHLPEMAALAVLAFTVAVVGQRIAAVLLNSTSTLFDISRIASGVALTTALVLNAVDRLQHSEASDLSALCLAINIVVAAALTIMAGLIWQTHLTVRCFGILATVHMMGAAVLYLTPRDLSEGETWYPRARSAATMSYLVPMFRNQDWSSQPEAAGQLTMCGLILLSAAAFWVPGLSNTQKAIARRSFLPAALIAVFLLVANAVLLLGPHGGTRLRANLDQINVLCFSCSILPPLLRLSLSCYVPLLALALAVHVTYTGAVFLGSFADPPHFIAVAYGAALGMIFFFCSLFVDGKSSTKEAVKASTASTSALNVSLILFLC